MNYYEVKLEYALSGWYNGRQEITHSTRHWEELIESDNPLQAIEDAKESVRDNELGGWSDEEDAFWRVSIASRVRVPEDCLFLDDRVIVGDGWVGDGFIVVPEGRAMWIEKYLWGGGVRPVDIEKELISQLASGGEELAFSHYGRAKDGWGWPMAVLRSADGRPVHVQRRYYDFACNQLAATSWQQQPFVTRKGDCCIVAYDDAGQAVAYVMAFVGPVEEP